MAWGKDQDEKVGNGMAMKIGTTVLGGDPE